MVEHVLEGDPLVCFFYALPGPVIRVPHILFHLLKSFLFNSEELLVFIVEMAACQEPIILILLRLLDKSRRPWLLLDYLRAQ